MSNTVYKIINRKGDILFELTTFEPLTDEQNEKVDELFSRKVVSFSFNLRKGKTLEYLYQAIINNTLDEVCESQTTVLDE